MSDDLVLEDAFDLGFSKTNPIKLLQLQVDTCGWSVERAFTATQQITDGGYVNLIGLFSPHELLLTVLLDREAIDEFHWLRAGKQVAGQVLEIVAGGFHTDQHYLGMSTGLGLIYRLTQLIEPALIDVNLKSWRHNLTQAIVDYGYMKVFADIQRDAQDLLRWNTSDEIGKSLTAFTA
jgi:ribosomal protein S16